MKKATLLLLFIFISFQLKSQNCNLICNGNFDSIPQSNPPAFVTNAQMPCWYTTSPDSLFEVWTSGFGGVPSYSGVQFIEVNGYYNATLYQSFYSSIGTVVTINFAHRGRAGVDTMGLAISPQGGPDTNLGHFGDGNSAWTYHSVNYTIPATGFYTIKFTSLYCASGNPTVGNFLDDVSVIGGTAILSGFSVQSTPCNLSIIITDTTQSGTTIFWDYGDGQTDSILNPNHVYTNSGTYTITQTVTNGCDTVTNQQTITVSSSAIVSANFTAQISDCDSSVIFNNLSSNGVQYFWNFGDGNTDTIANPVHQYASSGAYQVYLIATNPCGSDTLIQNIQINAIAPLQPGFTILSANCDLNIVITDQTQNGSSIFWNYGDGQTDSVLNPNHLYSANGNYTVTQTTTNGCDTIVTQQNVNVFNYPDATAVFNTQIYACDSTVYFNNLSSNGVQYLWLFGDGNTDTIANPVHQYNAIGAYQVTLIVINPCDTDSISQNIQINAVAPLQPGFTIQSTNCSFNIVITDQTQNGSSIFWNYGDGQTDSVLNPNHSYTANGTYTISQTTTNGCDTIITQHNVTIYSFPNVTSNFNPSITSCDSIVTFINQSTNALSYQWQFGDGTIDTVANPIHQYPSTGTYQVTLIATNPCDTDVYVMQVVLSSPLSEAQFSYILDTCTMQAFFTNASINASDYLWLFGDGTSSNDTNPSHIYENSAVYVVMLITDAGTLCADTFKLTIDLSNASSGNLFIPNCFTPNNDGINEVFEISGNLNCYTYELKIFNRWGQLIFENKDNLDFWNGTFNSGDVPEGVYFYVFTFNDTKKIGSITVLR